jgi:hypothetical protein
MSEVFKYASGVAGEVHHSRLRLLDLAIWERDNVRAFAERWLEEVVLLRTSTVSSRSIHPRFQDRCCTRISIPRRRRP